MRTLKISSIPIGSVTRRHPPEPHLVSLQVGELVGDDALPREELEEGRALHLAPVLLCPLGAEVPRVGVILRAIRGPWGQGCQMAKLDPFLSLDYARLEGVGAQSKERQGSNFAAQRSGAIDQKPEGPNTYDLKICL